MFSGLAALVFEDVEDAGEVIVVRAATRGGAVECPGCATPTTRLHAYHQRTPADVPLDGRRVLLRVRIRRMRCDVADCTQRTFREQVPGLLQRYQRRTIRLTGQIRATVRELAGRASARLLPALGMDVGRDTALRTLLGIPLPALRVPRVLGIDDFALRRGQDYATVLIDADTGRRVDVLPGRGAKVVTEWLRAHPGVEVVCRDGSTTYAQAVRDALPGAVQVADRWHLWHGLAEAAGKEVAAHSHCWAGATGLRQGRLAETTLQRWQQIHELLDAEVGLLDCSRRLGLALNTVKRYARAETPERIQRVPKYRPTLADPYRDHLRTRRAEDPGVPVTQLLGEIRELGYQGTSNLLYRYLNQGRHLDDQPHLSPRRATLLLLTEPQNLTTEQTATRDRLTAACPEITELATLIGSFAALLKPADDNDDRLRKWIIRARAMDLPHVHSFTRGLDQDLAAVTAALTLTHHNGRTEGVNTKTKMLKRQTYGRAGFKLLRHRILLA
ncbi:ISL3 family transposase [Saccharopolyspora shandongensis]